MRRLQTGTVEEQISELDALIDEVLRKPRNSTNVLINSIPSGIEITAVEVGITKWFMAFYTIDGTISDIMVKSPDKAKDVKVSLEMERDATTLTTSFKASQGMLKISEGIEVAAGSILRLVVETQQQLERISLGYVFTPKAR